jgi:hypothetical protein
MRQVFVKIPLKTKRGYRKVKIRKGIIKKHHLIAGQVCPFTGYALTSRR